MNTDKEFNDFIREQLDIDPELAPLELNLNQIKQIVRVAYNRGYDTGYNEYEEEQSKKTDKEKLKELAYELDLRIRKYSGRGMYGSECYGITSNENVSEIQILEEAGKQGLKGARWDSMGRNVIVYWPRVRVAEGDDIVEKDDDED